MVAVMENRPLNCYNLTEVMSILNLSRDRIFVHKRNNRLNSKKLNGNIWFSKKDILDFLTGYSNFQEEEATEYLNERLSKLSLP